MYCCRIIPKKNQTFLCGSTGHFGLGQSLLWQHWWIKTLSAVRNIVNIRSPSWIAIILKDILTIWTISIIIINCSDIRPTFLFWARGRTVALMRGLNRPLLTKLIHQEVDMEIRQESRSMNVEVHFDSDKVIQACIYFICHYIDIQYDFL